MNPYYTLLDSFLKEKNCVDWTLLHALAKADTSHLFKFHFYKNSNRDAFTKHLGLLEVTIAQREDLRNVVDQIITNNRDNTLILANLFIITWLISFELKNIDAADDRSDSENEDDLQLDLLEFYKALAGKTVCLEIFSLITKSLNENYFTHNRPKYDANTFTSWQNHLRMGAYYGMSDMVSIWLLHLVSENTQPDWQYQHWSSFGPVVRAQLSSAYGSIYIGNKNWYIDESDLLKEPAYFAAELARHMERKDYSVSWYRKTFLEIVLLDHWETAGRDLTSNIFHLHHNRQLASPQLATVIADAKKIFTDHVSIKEAVWLSEMQFVQDYKAFLYFAGIKQPEDFNDQWLTYWYREMLGEMEKWEKNKNPFLVKNRFDQFCLFEVRDNHFNMVLSLLSRAFIKQAGIDQRKTLRALYLRIQTTFFGSVQLRQIGMDYSKFLLIIILRAVDHLEDESDHHSLLQLITIFNSTVMTSLIHLLERDDYFWAASPNLIDPIPYYIDQLMGAVKKHDAAATYQPLWDAISEIKIGPWPHEISNSH